MQYFISYNFINNEDKLRSASCAINSNLKIKTMSQLRELEQTLEKQNNIKQVIINNYKQL